MLVASWLVILVDMAHGRRFGARCWFGVVRPTEQVNQHRYEALRAFFVEKLTHAQVAERFGYARWGVVNLVRDFRAGKLDLFAAPKPPGTAPARDRVRGRVVALR